MLNDIAVTNNGRNSTSVLSAGSAGGVAADIVLFPLDTIKTRAQSQLGLWKSGGLRNIFGGLLPVALGSAPSGASFFLAYDLSKCYTSKVIHAPVACHMISACCGETFSCLFRIPFEVVKQQTQAKPGTSSRHVFSQVIRSKGIPGLFQGYFSMIFREIPFTLIQFPLWEYFKVKVQEYTNRKCTPFQSATCGSVAGGFAGGLTTPFDVAKTRIILTKESVGENPYQIMSRIARNEGFTKLFSGIIPRVTWIAIGGFIFFGTYEEMKVILRRCGYV